MSKQHPTGLSRTVCLVAAFSTLIGAVGCQNLHAPRGRGKPLIQAPLSCSDFTISIYFEAGSAALTRQALALINAASDRTRGCAVTGINVVGLADAVGAPAANLVVSRRRADAVVASLHRRGFNTVAFQEAAAGNEGAQTRAGQAKPERRRADVAFHLAAKPAGAKP